MPAKLIVAAGASPGTEFPIQDEVLRIGSGGQCEFCLNDPVLAVHAATLEFRDGAYMLHNRSEDHIEVAGQSLGQRESARWPAGKEADFGHGWTLRLEIDGDPAPAKAAGPTYTIEYDAEEPDKKGGDKADQKGGFLKIAQVVVILAAVPLGIWMLMNEPSPDKGNPGEKRVSFNEVVTKLSDNARDKARGPLSFLAALQRGRAAELRGDRKDARAAYSYVRDTLLLLRQPDGKFREPEDQLVWDYVKVRLQAVHGGETP